VAAVIRGAVNDYASEVRAGTFPADEHCFGVKNR
jgi:ketopantoate hydroxymethyltransferase